MKLINGSEITTNKYFRILKLGLIFLSKKIPAWNIDTAKRRRNKTDKQKAITGLNA